MTAPWKRVVRWGGILLVFVTLLSSLAAVALSIYARSPIGLKEMRLVYIPQGASFSKAVEILVQAGLVRYPYLFSLLARVKNAHRRIKPGEYECPGFLSPAELIDKMVRGDVKQYWVTLPEDLTLKEIAMILADEPNRLVSREDFIRQANDAVFLETLGITGGCAEGYLFPETYRLYRGMDSRDIIRLLVGQFWKKLTPQWQERAKELGITLAQGVTIASLIGRETGYSEEKTLVSAVFHNRLRRKMRLQSDPTAIYGLEPWDGKVRKKDLLRDTPYNTYLISGLPPGPIANPGWDSLDAALHPAAVDYLYFVSKNDGSHVFSSHLKAHQEAVLKYQISKQKQ